MPNHVGVLGAIQVAEQDRTPIDPGGLRQRRLLAALAVRCGDIVSVDSLVHIVFEGNPSDSAERTLQSYVSRLRRAVDGENHDNGSAIERVGQGYVLRLEPHEFDAMAFEAGIERARALVADRDHAAAVRAFDSALRLWRGTPFAEFADEDWAGAEAHRLMEMRAGAIEERAESQLALGGHAEVIADLERFTREERLRERPRAQLMVALYRSGRQADALRVYQDYFALLGDEMGLEPSRDLRELEGRIVTGDPILDLGAVGGETLRGYRLFEELGRGAFSIVHRGTQPAVGRDVAVKTIRAELADDPDFVRRFETEAHMVANLEHPHIVPLYDFWRESGGAYLVMRWLRGGTLRDRLSRSALSLDDVGKLVRQVGDALEAAHRQGIVHRDIKPANVFCDDDDNFYLGDFGIAIGDTTKAAAAVHATTAPAYASPELLGHLPTGPAADIYSLGITVYEALTGSGPFADAATDEEIAHRQIHEPLPLVSSRRAGVSAGIDEVIQRATAKSVMGRYGSAREFVAAFAAATGTETVRAVAPSTPAAEPGPNPYKGLRAFSEADAADFFGRGELVDELLDHLRRDGPGGRLLTVVGPSGSGKSSVVRAGLLTALREGALAGSDRWFVAAFMPGASPYAELEAALLRIAVNPPASLIDQLTDGRDGIARAVKRVLPDDAAELVVVVDQAEELFTLTADPDEATAFVAGLLAAVDEPHSRLRVVFTLRADFYDRPLRDPRVAKRVKASTVVVTPLATEELAEAIALPARRAGAVFEDGLVARITADVADQPGALPLLQYTLAELYDRGQGRLTHTGYEEIGGVTGALASRAEATFANLSAEGRASSRLLFSRLVTLGSDTEDARRRVRASEFAEQPGVREAIDAYGSSRLLTFDRDAESREPTIEVAHEALIREWPRYESWIDDDRDGLRIHRHLTGAAEAWEQRRRDPAELYRGGRLESAVAWAASHSRDLNTLEQQFLEASSTEAEGQRHRAHRQTRRLRRAVAAIAAVAIVAVVAGVLAYREQQRTRDAQEAAEAAQAVADDARVEAEEATADLADQNEELEAAGRRSVVEDLGAAASDADDPEVAILLGLEGWNLDRESPAGLHTLAAGLLSESGWLGSLETGSLRAAPSTNRLVIRTPTEIVVRDLTDPFTVLDRIAVAPDDPQHPVAPAVSPDGTRVALGTEEGIQVVDLLTGIVGAPVSPVGEPAGFSAVGWTSDQQLLYNARPLALYTVNGLDLELERTVALPEVALRSSPGLIAVPDPARGLVAAHYQTGSVEIWDADRIGEPDAVVHVHDGFPGGVLVPSWGNDGELLVGLIDSSAPDQPGPFWRTGPDPTSEPIEVVSDHSAWRVTPRSDGTFFLTGLGGAAVVDANGTTVDGPILTGSGTPQDIIQLSEDRFVAGSLRTGSITAGPVRVWSLAAGTPLSAEIPGLDVPDDSIVQYFPEWGVATVARGREGPPILYHAIQVSEIWDVRTDQPRRLSYPGEDDFDRLRLSITDDGPVVVGVTDPEQPGDQREEAHSTTGGIATILDAFSGDPLAEVEIPRTPGSSISGLYVSSDRRHLTVSGNAPLRIFDIATGAMIRSIDVQGNGMWVVQNEALRRGFAVGGEVVTYDLDTFDVVARLPLGASDPLGDDTRALPSLSGELLAVGGASTAILDLPSGRLSASIDNPKALAARIDEARGLVIGWGISPDDGVQIWDLATTAPVTPFVPGPVGDQHIGGALVQVRDGRAHEWNLDVDSWPAIACRSVSRTLTEDEWATLVTPLYDLHLRRTPEYEPFDCASV